MSKSPNVIFACEYLLGLKNKSNKQYGTTYESNRSKDVSDMFDYFSNPKKSVVRLFDYYQGHTRDEDYNLILEDGSVATKEEIEKRKNNYKKYIKNSNLWKGIISFNNDFIDQNISFDNLEKRIATEVMPKFLKYCGFKNIKDMDYVFSIHTNTKHYHIHLAFIEKKPNYIYRNGKVGYRRLGMLSSDEKNYLKRLVQLAIERDKIYSPMLTQVNDDIDYLKKYFLPTEKNFVLKNISDIKTEENILRLGELLKQYRSNKNYSSNKMNYNSIKRTDIGKQILSLTKEIKNYLYNDENSLLHEDIKQLKVDLNNLNEYFNKLDSDNNIND
ncbi:MAG: relaxase MobL, partial [bacterium]|nr:relaxase MobL [bacterium]